MSWIRENSLSWLQRMCINVVKSGQIPKHVAFIMDGNRRYAEKNNVQTIDGHSKGFEKLAETLVWCRDLGIPEVTVYAFSIENFKRSPEEVDALMELARQKFQRLLDEKDKLMEHGVKVRVIGKLSLLPVEIRKLIAEAMKITKNNTKSTLNVAFSYTAREEMTQAMSAIVSGVADGSVDVGDVSTELFSDCLYTSPSPHPELVIRTSGEVRLSDFLLWQTSFSCIYFTAKLWPDFRLWNMLAAVLHFQRTFPHLAALHEGNDNRCLQPATSDFVHALACSREIVFS